MKKREKKLGVTNSHKRKYDIPLAGDKKGLSLDFLTLIICLMTFLASLSLSASFVLSAMTERWSSGLENAITIEIPSRGEDGKLITNNRMDKIKADISEVLLQRPEVINADILSSEQIKALVEPWLGNSNEILNVPLPGIISVDLKDKSSAKLKSLESKIRQVSPTARIETHKEWLSNLLDFTGALKMTAALLSIIIAFTTITAVSGAVKSRMAEHHSEIELLYLMGATDSYISRQFQRYATIIAARGGAAGIILGAISIATIGWISGEMGVALMPEFHMSNTQIFAIAMLPVIAAIIAAIVTKRTVTNTLMHIS
jgi:cell division transport system permease protein